MAPSRLHELFLANMKSASLTTAPLQIVVGIGPDAKSFYLDEGLATFHSRFFAAALRNGWKEAADHQVKLKDERSEIFEIFARFLYTGKVYSCKEGDSVEKGKDQECPRLRNCWFAGDRLDSTSFKDAVIDAMCEKIRTENKIPMRLHPEAYTATTTANPFRRLTVDIAIWNWVGFKRTGVIPPGCDEFWRDLATRRMELKDSQVVGEAPYRQISCDYHEHTVHGTACYKTMFNDI